MMISRCMFAAVAFASALTQAQVAPAGRTPPPVNFAAMLDIDDTRAQVVEAILENAQERVIAACEQIGRPTDDTARSVMRAAMHAIRAEADKQLASVLAPEELARLKELLPPPGAEAAPQSSIL